MKSAIKARLLILACIMSNSILMTLQAQENETIASIAIQNKNALIIEKPVNAAPTKLASFQGGAIAWQTYIQEKLVYPSLAQENGVEGSVIAKFTVTPSGEVKNIIIEQSLGFGCDEAVKNLLEHSPHWNPALQHGRTTPSNVKVVIDFKLR